MEVKRKRGRPRKDQQNLSKRKIIVAALHLLEDANASLSVHNVARALKVDPMAIYTYFSSHTKLVEAVAMEAFSSLSDFQQPNRNWRKDTKALVLQYLALLLEKPGLLTAVLRLGLSAEGPATIFRKLFTRAIATLQLTEQQLTLVENLLVDYIHGFALAASVSEDGILSAKDAEPAVDFYLRCLGSYTMTA